MHPRHQPLACGAALRTLLFPVDCGKCTPTSPYAPEGLGLGGQDPPSEDELGWDPRSLSPAPGTNSPGPTWTLEQQLALLNSQFNKRVLINLFVWNDDQNSSRHIIYVRAARGEGGRGGGRVLPQHSRDRARAMARGADELQACSPGPGLVHARGLGDQLQGAASCSEAHALQASGAWGGSLDSEPPLATARKPKRPWRVANVYPHPADAHIPQPIPGGSLPARHSWGRAWAHTLCASQHRPPLGPRAVERAAAHLSWAVGTPQRL